LSDAENSSLNILIYLYWINSSLLLEDSWINYSSRMFWLLNKIFVAGFRNANKIGVYGFPASHEGFTSRPSSRRPSGNIDLPYARKAPPLKLNDYPYSRLTRGNMQRWH